MVSTILTDAKHPFVMLLPEPYTVDALAALSDMNPTLRFEQNSEGYLIVSPPTAASGNEGELELIGQVRAWNKRVRFGKVGGLTAGIKLPKGGDYIPDVYVVPGAMWDAMPPRERDANYAPVCPIAIFEMLSPGNKTATGFTADVQKKLEDCERSAVPVVILLDPKPRTTALRRPGQNDVILDTPIVTIEELPGLELDVAAVFAAIQLSGERNASSVGEAIERHTS